MWHHLGTILSVIRWHFRILSLLSLLLCLTLLGLWLRSLRTDDRIRFTSGDRLVMLHSVKDGIKVTSISHWPAVQPYSRDGAPRGTMPDLDIGWGPRGTGYHRWSRYGLSGAHGAINVLQRDGSPFWTTKQLHEYHGSEWRGLGFYPESGGLAYWSITIPHWLAATAGALLPLAALSMCLATALRRRRRLRLHLCPMCSYDLRATPDRCPECGTTPSGAPKLHREPSP
jgi:hypothetical protein